MFSEMLGYIGVFAWALVWTGQITAIISSVLRASKQKAGCQESKRDIPLGVTILKPVVGVDSHLKQNLKTFFHLDYEQFQIIFCVQNKHDSAIETIQNLREEYPDVDTSITVGPSQIGQNPKINNIYKAYQEAKYDLIWICDSGVSASPPDVLRDMVATMCKHSKTCSVVHQLPLIDQPEGLGPSLEQVYFGTKHSRWYLVFDILRQNCVNGMSNLYSRSALESVGGLERFSDVIAEDFFISKALYDKGLTPRLAKYAAQQRSGSRSLQQVYDRHLRWSRLRNNMLPVAATALEPVLECVVIGIIGSLSLVTLVTSFQEYAAWIFMTHVLLWYLGDMCLLYILQDSRNLNLMSVSLLWVLREFGGLFLYLHSLTSNMIIWRGAQFRIGKGGVGKKL
eukprot:m.161271 g.161271  ORF g.161271 m.161271 type:complete len:396 (+) comp15185_c0_seq3:331-1518(+)